MSSFFTSLTQWDNLTERGRTCDGRCGRQSHDKAVAAVSRSCGGSCTAVVAFEAQLRIMDERGSRSTTQ